MITASRAAVAARATPRGVAPVQREENPADRGFAPGPPVLAAEPATRVGTDLRAAAEPAGVVEDAEETRERIPPTEPPSRGGASLRQLRARRGSLRNQRVSLALERPEVPQPLQAPQSAPLSGVQSRRRLGVRPAALQGGFVMRQRLGPLAVLLVL